MFSSFCVAVSGSFSFQTELSASQIFPLKKDSLRAANIKLRKKYIVVKSLRISYTRTLDEYKEVYMQSTR